MYAEFPRDQYLDLSYFCICVKDLRYALNLLEPIMFADDTNLFYAEENIKTLFDTVNIEFKKMVSALFTINYF